MLKKIKADRERSQEIKQQDIFYITKYANKFKIDTKNLINWAFRKFDHVQAQKRFYLDQELKKGTIRSNKCTRGFELIF
jgi:5-methylcytosine-specific restriction endonuclease McrBC regulatory subunit McrC